MTRFWICATLAGLAFALAGCQGEETVAGCTKDSDCKLSETCVNSVCKGPNSAGETACDDETDNDGDSKLDCADENCAGRACGNGKICTNKACVAAPNEAEQVCSDSIDDDGDGQLDCADSDCAGEACAAGKTCQNGSCAASAGGVVSCSDGIRNQDESDVDCGGSKCSKCATYKTCSDDGDCVSGNCSGGNCLAAPSCTDGARNGNETDMDCGGGTCPGCADNRACNVDSDCAAGTCVASACKTVSCTNGSKDGTETGIDCGGGCPNKCIVGQGCGSNDDCLSANCTGGVCTAGASCTDGIKNGPETDVDCGGPSCPPCAPYKACSQGSDCAQKICTSGACAMNSCTDGLQNGDETGVDCGGTCTKKCANGAACLSGADCVNAFCDANKVCATAVSCKAIKESWPSAPDAKYTIDPDGTGSAPAMPTFCRMTVDGGGWTLLMRTVYYWNETRTGTPTPTSSSILLTNFAGFYGSSATTQPIGRPDTGGNSYRLPGRHWATLTTTGEHLVYLLMRGSTGKDCKPMVFKATSTGDWDMNLTAKSAHLVGTISQAALPIFKGPDISTTDSGPYTTSCVNQHSAVPWAYAACCTVCPTYDSYDKLSPAAASPKPRPMLTNAIGTAKDITGTDITTACAGVGGPARKLASGTTNYYYAANQIEYLVR